MPRELTLVSGEPLELDLVLAAAASVAGHLEARLVLGGWALQLVDPDGLAVLTIEQSRRLDRSDDVTRISEHDPPPGPVWWTEATAPWGPAGEPGVQIAYAVAARAAAQIRTT